MRWYCSLILTMKISGCSVYVYVGDSDVEAVEGSRIGML